MMMQSAPPKLRCVKCNAVLLISCEGGATGTLKDGHVIIVKRASVRCRQCGRVNELTDGVN